MLTRNWPRHLLCLSLSLPLGSALACGPDFPMRLLDNRGQSLAELPEGNFNFEISRLGKTIAGLKNVTSATHNPDDMYGDENEPAALREKAEQVGLSAEQQALVKQLRGLTDARQVEAQGASLPAEIRLYVAGAVAFATGDHPLAIEYFNKVLALPADQRPLRSTWAAYSLGRTLFAMSAEAGDVIEVLEDARAAFRQARQLSIDGFSDPLELGVASLGEEARVLRNAGDWNGAIELYEAQNLHGSAVGYTSLKQLMNELAELPEPQLAKLLERKAVQQLVTASLISRVGWSFDEQPPNEKKLIKLLQNSTRGSLENADRLAAMNYQQGDYASAKAFLRMPVTADWRGGCEPNWQCVTVIKMPRLPPMPKLRRLSRRARIGATGVPRTGTSKPSSRNAGSRARARFSRCSVANTCKRSCSCIAATASTGSTRRRWPSAC